MASKFLLSVLLILVSLGHTFSSPVSTITRKAQARTDLTAERLICEWTINNFSLLPQEKGEFIESPIFHTESNDAGWKLRLYPRGFDQAEYMGLYLELNNRSHGKLKVHWKILVINSNEVKIEKTYEVMYDRPRLVGDSKFLRRSDLVNITSPDEAITLRAEIDMPVKTATVEILDSDLLIKDVDRKLDKYKWDDHFSQLFKDPKFSDVTVIVSNETFLAHKVILTRSPVLAVILERNQTKEVKIEDVEPVVVKAVLEYIYTDEVEDLEILADGLLGAADKFQLPQLKTMCEMVLYKTLNEKSAADLLILGDAAHSNKLKDHATKFIVDHFSGVIKSEGYKKIQQMYPDLLSELFLSIITKN